MRLLVIAILGVGFGACKPSESVGAPEPSQPTQEQTTMASVTGANAEHTTTAQSRDKDETLTGSSRSRRSLDALKVPARIDEPVLTQAAEALLKSVEPSDFNATVKRPEFGRATIREDGEGQVLGWYEMRKLLRKPKDKAAIASAKPLRSFHRLIRNRPIANVSAEGVLTVRFRTIRPVSNATLYLGEYLRGDVISTPRYRMSTQDLRAIGSADASHTYEISFPLHRLHKWKYRTEGPQHDVAWRLELFDEKLGTSRMRDGRTSVRCDPGPCGARDRAKNSQAVYHMLPSFFANPVVDQVSHEGAVVSFRSDVPATAALLVSDGDSVTQFHSKAPTTAHEIRITALKPSTAYRYAVVMRDSGGQVSTWPGATFRTAPLPGTEAPVRIAVMSDSRSGAGTDEENYCNVNRSVLEGLMSNALRGGADAVVFVGDLVDGYTTESEDLRYQLEGWLQVTAPYGAYVPIFEAIGNHEAVVSATTAGWISPAAGSHSPEAVFKDVFANPSNGPIHPDSAAPTLSENTYSLDYGNVHIAVVNSNYWVRSHPDNPDHPLGLKGHREGMVDPAILEWLDRDLADARARGQKHLLVATHEPMFPNGGHPKDGMWWFGKIDKVNRVRNELLSLLSKHRVAAILHGDEHNYSRLIIQRGDAEPFEAAENPVTQIITGGAGAPWYVQQMDLPWSKQVETFDLRQHLVFLDADGDMLTGTVQSVTGETIEQFILSASGE